MNEKEMTTEEEEYKFYRECDEKLLNDIFWMSDCLPKESIDILLEVIEEKGLTEKFYQDVR